MSSESSFTSLTSSRSLSSFDTDTVFFAGASSSPATAMAVAVPPPIRATAVMVAMTMDDQRSADSLARVFTVPGEAESLAFRAQRGGVNYTLAVTEASDSLLYRQAKASGAGSVMGPERVSGGWRVIKVLSLDPSQPQPFGQVRGEVQRSWYEYESERRIRGRLDELKRRAHIQYNDKALRGLVLSTKGARG